MYGKLIMCNYHTYLLIFSKNFDISNLKNLAEVFRYNNYIIKYVIIPPNLTLVLNEPNRVKLVYLHNFNPTLFLTLLLKTSVTYFESPHSLDPILKIKLG